MADFFERIKDFLAGSKALRKAAETGSPGPRKSQGSPTATPGNSPSEMLKRNEEHARRQREMDAKKKKSNIRTEPITTDMSKKFKEDY